MNENIATNDGKRVLNLLQVNRNILTKYDLIILNREISRQLINKLKEQSNENE